MPPTLPRPCLSWYFQHLPTGAEAWVVAGQDKFNTKHDRDQVLSFLKDWTIRVTLEPGDFRLPLLIVLHISLSIVDLDQGSDFERVSTGLKDVLRATGFVRNASDDYLRKLRSWTKKLLTSFGEIEERTRGRIWNTLLCAPLTPSILQELGTMDFTTIYPEAIETGSSSQSLDSLNMIRLIQCLRPNLRHDRILKALSQRHAPLRVVSPLGSATFSHETLDPSIDEFLDVTEIMKASIADFGTYAAIPNPEAAQQLLPSILSLPSDTASDRLHHDVEVFQWTDAHEQLAQLALQSLVRRSSLEFHTND
ncbi:hypothetical protein S40288_11644 [Stachybotrys chartarum IBT 40288]|nr:hypothetical protein S40288_11644 [Stachybotrys chartarum IBT 40288]